MSEQRLAAFGKTCWILNTMPCPIFTDHASAKRYARAATAFLKAAHATVDAVSLVDTCSRSSRPNPMCPFADPDS